MYLVQQRIIRERNKLASASWAEIVYYMNYHPLYEAALYPDRNTALCSIYKSSE
jgi:hypothetical protein